MRPSSVLAAVLAVAPGLRAAVLHHTYTSISRIAAANASACTAETSTVTVFVNGLTSSVTANPAVSAAPDFAAPVQYGAVGSEVAPVKSVESVPASSITSIEASPVQTASKPDFGGPYTFGIDNGTTSWAGGRAPPTSATPLSTQILLSTIFVSPIRTVSYGGNLGRSWSSKWGTWPATEAFSYEVAGATEAAIDAEESTQGAGAMKTKDSIPTGSFPTYTPVHGMGVFPSAAGASAPTGSSGTVGSFSAATGTTRPKASTLRITVNAASRSVGTAAIFSTATHKSTTTASIDACGADGERGNFTLTWDDEPLLVSKPNEVDFTPVFNPYHHMFFSNGYAYVPPPGEPFDAASAPNLAIFLPNASRTDVGSADGPAVQPGEIGAGPRANSKYFHFGAFSAEMGCDHSGLDFCQMMITGYGWEGGKQVVKVRQEVDIPPCDTMPHCKLSHIGFRQDFRDLSGIQFEAFINGTQRIFVMDNLQLQWTDNSCEAGTYRTSHRK